MHDIFEIPDNIKAIQLEIKSENKHRAIITAVYRSPDSNFVDNLNALLERNNIALTNEYKNF